jgi:hypothetical protein
MKVSKISVWKTSNMGMILGQWVIDVYDENGNYHAKLFSETEPIVEKENSK